MPRALATGLLVLAAATSSSCIDPVHSDNVAALGPEVSGVREGPTHRPGQPCLVCHGGQGPGSPEFSIAGTVYAVRNKPNSLSRATVVLTDAKGVTKTRTTNEVGTFYFEPREWSPAYPVAVELQNAGKVKAMESRIGREGSCAFCHYGADNEATHMPPVFMSDL
jgi:hypothetical protein